VLQLAEHALETAECYPALRQALLAKKRALAPVLAALVQKSAQGAMKQFNKHVLPQLALMRRSRVFDITKPPEKKPSYKADFFGLSEAQCVVDALIHCYIVYF
jgi:hypothetical protein